MTMIGIKIIGDLKLVKISKRSPATMKAKPPNLSYFQAMMVKMIKMKLGIKWISKGKNHCGFSKTSKANELIKMINKIDIIRGSQYKNFFIISSRRRLFFHNQFYLKTQHL